MGTMPGVPTLEHFGLCAPRDKFEALLKFYEGVFGWHRIREVGDTIVFIGDGQGGRLELIVNDVPPLARPHHGAFVLPMEHYDAARAALTDGEAEIVVEQTSPSGDRLLFFNDPAGNYMQIVFRIEALGK
jgi:predicted enzyme related to lactoylglutathione lyase